MIKRKAILSACMILVLTMVGCSSKNDKTTSKKTDTNTETTTNADEKRTTFTVGFDANFPPYGYQDENGEYVGFDLDLAEEVCKRKGWELVKTPIDWDSKDMELSSGTIDCIWNGFTMSEDRIDDYTWSEPYVDNTQVVVVDANSGIKTKDDLAGKVVAVQAASSALEAINSDDNKDLKASFGELLEVPDYNSAFMNLEAGAVDAVALDIGVAKYQVEKRGDQFVILDDKISSEVYGIGFLKGNESLREIGRAHV